MVFSEELAHVWGIAEGASTLLPNIEELTIRVCLSRRLEEDEYEIERWKETVERIIDHYNAEGWWSRLRTINFERQSWATFTHLC